MIVRETAYINHMIWQRLIDEHGVELTILERCHLYRKLHRREIHANTNLSHREVKEVMKILLARGWVVYDRHTRHAYRVTAKGAAVLQLCVWKPHQILVESK